MKKKPQIGRKYFISEKEHASRLLFKKGKLLELNRKESTAKKPEYFTKEVPHICQNGHHHFVYVCVVVLFAVFKESPYRLP